VTLETGEAVALGVACLQDDRPLLEPVLTSWREAPVRRLGTMPRKKVTIRPPGLKPTTKVGTLGPYRGRLGLAWVIAPIVAGLVILVAGYVALFR
jgi:hypothetical protein